MQLYDCIFVLIIAVSDPMKLLMNHDWTST